MAGQAQPGKPQSPKPEESRARVSRADEGTTEPQAEITKDLIKPEKVCCWFMLKGRCTPPRSKCHFRHEIDDGAMPCNFGAKCQQGHKYRAPPVNWIEYNRKGHTVGQSPALRDAQLLRSQLEPLGTGTVRMRIVEHYGGSYDELDPMERCDLMALLLAGYAKQGPRVVLRRQGTLVRPQLVELLLGEMEAWALKHRVNHRPSIAAKSYTILRSPVEFGSANSRNALKAAKKLHKHQAIWDLAMTAMAEVDPDFEVSSLALTKGFSGSPHIDKQNSGPFYGMSLGSFEDGTGGVRVEAHYDVVVEVNTKNRLGRVDGRHVHWVAPYDGERYSLIFYQTRAKFMKPQNAVWPPVTDQEVQTCSQQEKKTEKNEDETKLLLPDSFFFSAAA